MLRCLENPFVLGSLILPSNRSRLLKGAPHFCRAGLSLYSFGAGPASLPLFFLSLACEVRHPERLRGARCAKPSDAPAPCFFR